MKSEEREFFKTVRGAIFSNPFGQTRAGLDRLATGLAPTTPLDKILTKLIEKVGKVIGEVELREGVTLSREDTLLLEYGKLFYTFHIFSDDYDNHIQEQIEKGDECCKVPFAADIVQMLSNFAFTDRDVTRYVALFFQMRRAFFFIKSIVGKSTGVMNLRRALWNNIFTGDINLYDTYLWDRMEDFSTMILGETGTGKGMAAAAIGRSGFIPFNAKKNTFSESFAKAFISINLSQYPEQLIESELFGHKKGAFTGAIEGHHGVFSRCSPCGAIFIDEIGDVAIPVQIKLLQVLQSRTFSPVGSHATEKFQGRVIAATNKDLSKLRQDGDFRDDFYYRLCSDVIEVPPLRQRLVENKEELKDLLAVTVQRIVGKKSAGLADEMYNYITTNQPTNYPWPGNIRELEQCVRRVLLSSKYTWQHASTGETPTAQLMVKMEGGTLTAQELLARYCALLYRQHQTYEAVARITQLDRRTVKKYIESI